MGQRRERQCVEKRTTRETYRRIRSPNPRVSSPRELGTHSGHEEGKEKLPHLSSLNQEEGDGITRKLKKRDLRKEKLRSLNATSYLRGDIITETMHKGACHPPNNPPKILQIYAARAPFGFYGREEIKGFSKISYVYIF